MRGGPYACMQEHFQAQAWGEWLLCHPHNPVTGLQHLGHAVLLTPSQQEGTGAVCEPGVTSSRPVCLLCWPAGVNSLTVPLSKQTWQPALKMYRRMCSSQLTAVQLTPQSCKLPVMLYHCRVCEG